MQTTNALKKSGSAQSTREKIIVAARKLVNSKGFHAMTTAELAVEAGINNALIYRHFRSKDDIILVVAEQFTDAQIQQRKELLEAATRGELSVFAAIKDLAYKRLINSELGLFFEILAESCRNAVMAECTAMTETPSATPIATTRASLMMFFIVFLVSCQLYFVLSFSGPARSARCGCMTSFFYFRDSSRVILKGTLRGKTASHCQASLLLLPSVS